MYNNHIPYKQPHNLVGIVMGYDLGRQGSILNKNKIFLFYVASRSTLAPTSLLSSGYWGLLPRSKEVELEADHSKPSSKVKNYGAILLSPHTSSLCAA
jgi:hypothetical protein